MTPLATGLALIAAGSAHAQIVYSGIQDIPLTLGGSAATVDLSSNPNSSITVSVVNETVMSTSNTKPQVTVNSNDLAIHGSNGPFGYVYSSLTPGSSVATSFATQGTAATPYSFYGSSASNVNQPYVAFALNVNETPLYGWADLTYNGAGSATLVDWAYQSNGADILAGDNGMSAVPEPADTALLMGAAALLAGSAAIWRKRQLGTVAA